MSSKPEWQRYMEVLVLDGKVGEGSGTQPGNAMFPGDNLSTLEFTPKPEYHPAGLPTPTLDRKVSDIFVVRVTDETVPDAGKKRMVISLSIHGIERAGLEGGTRAMEELVTAFTTGKAAKTIVPATVKANAPTFGDVLKKTIIYFTYPYPDGWRRARSPRAAFSTSATTATGSTRTATGRTSATPSAPTAARPARDARVPRLLRRPAGEGARLRSQPSTQEDHPLGLEPYAVTYTGYILVRNLFEVSP